MWPTVLAGVAGILIRVFPVSIARSPAGLRCLVISTVPFLVGFTNEAALRRRLGTWPGDRQQTSPGRGTVPRAEGRAAGSTGDGPDTWVWLASVALFLIANIAWADGRRARGCVAPSGQWDHH